MEVVPCQTCSRCLNLSFPACVNMPVRLGDDLGSPALSCEAQWLLGSPYIPKESLTSEQVITLVVLDGVAKCSSHGHFQL